MYEVSVNGIWNRKISLQDGEVRLEDETVAWSQEPLQADIFSVLLNNKSFTAQLISTDRHSKTMLIRINGRDYCVSIREPVDRVLADMGIRPGNHKKTNEIRAPMPGLILKVLVKPGQAVKQGDPLVILEAMKMENTFKAEADAMVKEVKVAEHTAVEKGEVLIMLE